MAPATTEVVPRTPARRPNLVATRPITTDAQGFLVAQSDFHEAVGPSFWERS